MLIIRHAQESVFHMKKHFGKHRLPVTIIINACVLKIRDVMVTFGICIQVNPIHLIRIVLGVKVVLFKQQYEIRTDVISLECFYVTR